MFTVVKIKNRGMNLKISGCDCHGWLDESAFCISKIGFERLIFGPGLNAGPQPFGGSPQLM